MIPYVIKTVLCSASLFAIYYLFLEREKMYRFNRFYLLFSLLFSFTVSFITIKVAAPIMPAQETVVLTDNSLPAIHTTTVSTPTESFNLLPYLLPAFYLLVSSFLFFRFVSNLKKLLFKIKGNETVSYSGATLVLTKDNPIPFSFLNWIFINREKYERGLIEKEVLQHELTHVRQMHSLDVILVELVIALAWFNPLLFLFRRSILLNHEFLADESVVETFDDPTTYQLLLFEKANRKNNLVLSSSFNYLITKKRLIMMTRKTSQKVAIIKQIAIIPLIVGLGFMFSTKVVAQDNPDLLKQKQMEYSKLDASQKLVDEYKAKLLQYGVMTKDGKYHPGNNRLNAAQRNELAALFMKMSKKQQGEQDIIFTAMPGPSPKSVPTKEQFEAYKNPKTYGVWIDGKKVDNSVLNKYANTDFDQADVSVLRGNAKKNVSYQMQLNLMTKGYYQKYYDESMYNLKNDKYRMGVKMYQKSSDAYIDQKKKDSASLLEQKMKLDKEQQEMMKDQRLKMNNQIIRQKELQSEMELQKANMSKDQKEKLDALQKDMNKLKAEMEIQKAKMKTVLDKKGLIKIVFTNDLTSKDLIKIQNDLKAIGITLIYNNLEFGKDDHLISIDFTVNCNDGFKGSASGHPLTNKDFRVGFFRDYSKNAESPFGTGSM